MRVEIDVAACCGHAMCTAIAPDVYQLNDEGYQYLASVEVPPELESDAVRAAASCPEQCLHVITGPSA
jgi:ferredoxin